MQPIDANTRTLIETIAHTCVFLEFSADDSVSTDAAVAALEDIASTLHGLDSDGRSTFLALTAEISANFTDPAQRDFVRTLGRALGIDP